MSVHKCFAFVKCYNNYLHRCNLLSWVTVEFYNLLYLSLFVGNAHNRPSWKVPSHKYGTPSRMLRHASRVVDLEVIRGYVWA